MQKIDGKLCVSYPELTDGIVSISNYQQLVLRNKIQVLLRGCLDTPALIDFKSLPTHIKTACIEKYGSPQEQI